MEKLVNNFTIDIKKTYPLTLLRNRMGYVVIGKAAAFVFFVFAEGWKYQRAYIFIPKIAQRILIFLVWNITIHS